jgi:hypothetical protein
MLPLCQEYKSTLPLMMRMMMIDSEKKKTSYTRKKNKAGQRERNTTIQRRVGENLSTAAHDKTCTNKNINKQWESTTTINFPMNLVDGLARMCERMNK